MILTKTVVIKQINNTAPHVLSPSLKRDVNNGRETCQVEDRQWKTLCNGLLRESSSCLTTRRKTSSFFLDMGTLAPDTGSGDSDMYLALGLKGSRKGALGAPRVLKLLSSLLERSVQTNEKILETMETKDAMTIFHGLRAPSLSIGQYIDRIFKYSCCSPSCFVVAHIYVDRFLQQTDVRLTSLNVHRLLITSVMLAAKFMDDAFFNNAYYAKVGGVSTSEMNRLEMKFLFSIDFRLQVNVTTFERYCYQMDKEGTEGFQIERPIQACRLKESWLKKDDSTTCTPRIAR